VLRPPFSWWMLRGDRERMAVPASPLGNARRLPPGRRDRIGP
jgi:hypothetical protein